MLEKLYRSVQADRGCGHCADYRKPQEVASAGGGTMSCNEMTKSIKLWLKNKRNIKVRFENSML